MGGGQIVVVGAGHAGGRAAQALRIAGFEGRVVLLGEEPHPPYERPPLSKGRLSGEVAIEKTYLKPQTFYAEAAIDLRLDTRVAGLDRTAQRVRLANGEAVAYDRLLLATGARPRRLEVTGAGCGCVLYLRDHLDAEALRARLAGALRVAVIGAGLIGLEVAAAARKQGAEVIVLEALEAPLLRVVAPEIGAWFAARHAAHGVEVRTGASVVEIVEQARGARVLLAGGAGLDVDLVVVGIGAIPNQELAAEAGLAVANGVVVDEFGRTGDPQVFAAGDVANAYHPSLGRHVRLETWRNAQDQPVAVAKVMAGGSEPYDDVPWFWTDQYGFNMQMAGLPLAWDQLVWRGAPADEKFTVFYLDRGRMVAANALNNARDIRMATDLIRRKAPVDPAALADPGVKLAELALAAQ